MIKGYIWTDPNTGKQHALDPKDVTIVSEAEGIDDGRVPVYSDIDGRLLGWTWPLDGDNEA